jgi:hypothetical protein
MDNNFVNVNDIRSMGETINELNNGMLNDVHLIPQKAINMVPGESPMFNNTEGDSLKGIHESSGVSETYFSRENMATLQATIRYEVHKNTNKIIDRQSEQELNIVMRSIYLQHGNPVIPSNNIINEIQKLNEMVVNFCTGQITTQVKQYIGYIKKLSSLPIPIDRPQYLNKENYTYDMSNLMN